MNRHQQHMAVSIAALLLSVVGTSISVLQYAETHKLPEISLPKIAETPSDSGWPPAVLLMLMVCLVFTLTWLSLKKREQRTTRMFNEYIQTLPDREKRYCLETDSDGGRLFTSKMQAQRALRRDPRTKCVLDNIKTGR
jgi:hypothetical protein